MAFLDGSVSEHLDKRKNDLHIIEALLELLVSGVLLGVGRKTHAVFKELLNAFFHA